MMNLRAHRSLAAISVLALAACYQGLEIGPPGAGDGPQDEDSGPGSDSGDGPDDEPGDEPDDGPGDEPEVLCNGEPAVSSRPLRRLSPSQYHNTMRDLLGDPGFVVEYDGYEEIVTERAVRQLRNGAETAFARREHWNADVFACDLGGPADDACADDLIDRFAPRAFRRPLRDEERLWLRGIYQDARSELDFGDSMEILTQTILQAPAFLYLEEVGEPIEGAPAEIRRLTDHEMANRLSYFLWDTMPDEALLEAAAQGRLTSSEGLAEEVERMLDDPRAEGMAEDFVWHWLHLDGGAVHFALEDAMKDPELFPEFGPPLQDAMRTELEMLVATTFEEGGTLADLFSSRRAYVNRALADLYGVGIGDGPGDDDTWAWIDLDGTQRAGLLTRAAFLTVYAANRAQAPIRRGVTVLENVLCMSIPPPPPEVDDTPPQGNSDEDEPMSVRQEVEARTADAACSGCHGMINPIGFTFEHYDAIGRWQDDELVSGLPIDSRATIDVPAVGETADAIVLSEWLATSDEAAACFAGRWFDDALGGPGGPAEDCERERIAKAFMAGGDLRSLVKEIVASAPFRYINTANEEE